MPAIELFTVVIEYLKKKALKDIHSKPPTLNMENFGEIQEDKIDYAITVPAFWHDSVRQLVTYAAVAVIKAFCLSLPHTKHLDKYAKL